MKNKITKRQSKILIIAAILYSILTNIPDIVKGFNDGFKGNPPLTSIK